VEGAVSVRGRNESGRAKTTADSGFVGSSRDLAFALLSSFSALALSMSWERIGGLGSGIYGSKYE